MDEIELPAERGGGPLVKDYGDFFLRDDTEIRRSSGCFEDQVEGYSLFRVEPYGRERVFGGSRAWAVGQADKLVDECRQKAAKWAETAAKCRQALEQEGSERVE